jgi:hypothetical protein
MSSFIETQSERIEAREIPDSERLPILPRHFGRHMLTVEHAVYSFMRRLSSEYTGGYWIYVELSNGGFYMAPTHEAPVNVRVDTNGFEGPMSADAAGITACQEMPGPPRCLRGSSFEGRLPILMCRQYGAFADRMRRGLRRTDLSAAAALGGRRGADAVICG